MTNDDRPASDEVDGADRVDGVDDESGTVTTEVDDAAARDDLDDLDDRGYRPQRRPALWQESLLLVVAAVVVAVVVKALFVQAFYIPSDSMQPGLQENDRILVQKPAYWFGSPSRGDVVVFKDPGGWLGNTEVDDAGPLKDVLSAIGLYPQGGHLVKRVVGVAGDVITCCDAEGRILVNGKPVDEPYLATRPDGSSCNSRISTCEWSAGPVPEGKLFVMGDNRWDSADSTFHMCLPDELDCHRDPYVDVDLVTGKVFAVAWPLGHLGLRGGADSFDGVPAPKS